MNEKKFLTKISHIIKNHNETILIDIKKDFFEILCGSIYIKNFESFFTSLNKELENLSTFFNTGDKKIPQLAGKHSLSKGITENIIFPFFDNIYSFILDYIDMDKANIKTLSKLFNEYIKHYIIAFNQEKDEKKNVSHAQLYKAVNNVVQVQHQKIITLQKNKTKMAQKEARKRQKFLIQLAHDIMSPLTLVRIQINKYIANGFKDDLLSLQTNIIKLIEMISSFFDYEKMEKSEMLYMHSDYINFSGYLLSKINLSQQIFEERKIKVSTNIQDQIFIKIHKHALDRILNNVIDNAVKYNKPNGKIEITLKKEDKIYLIIEDSGIGMSREYINTLFQPYYERSRNSQNIAGGMGEGLSIIKNILLEISGSIDIQSKEGKGTTVILSFINENDNIKKAIRKTSSPLVLFHSKPAKLTLQEFDRYKKTILLVEDNKEFLALLHNDLCKEFNVFYAYDGKEALELLFNFFIPCPEIIISDIMMQNVDGHELHKRIYSTESFKHIPFIFITAKRDENDKIKSYQKGVIDYIQKPFLFEELMYKIKALLYTIEVKNQKAYIEMMEKQKDQVMRDRASDIFLCYHLTCQKYKLNRREKEITRYYLKGVPGKEIADKLFLSHHTVKRHIQSIYSKCNVSNRAELCTAFNFYESHIIKVLNRDFRNEELLKEALEKDWRNEASFFDYINNIASKEL